MKVYDESGNFLGEFMESTSNVVEGVKDTVLSMKEASLLLGLIGLIFAPAITLIIIIVLFIFHLIIGVIKLILKSIWWMIRLPFTLIFLQRTPRF